MPSAHPFRSRGFLAALAALVLLLALTPFLPDDDAGRDDDGEYAALGALRSANRTGYGDVTPDLQREIDRVVGQGARMARLSPRAAARTPVGDLVARGTRCADFEGLRYCLGVGWTEKTQAQVRARAMLAARTAPSAIAARGDVSGDGTHGTGAGNATPETTGDLDAFASLQRSAALPTARRANAERAELTQAARSVAKVWLLRHEILGEPLPPGFLERHPEARAIETDASESGAIEAGAAGNDAVQSGAALQVGAPVAAGPTGGATPVPPATPGAPTMPPTIPATVPVTATGVPTVTPTVKTAAEYPARDKILNNAQVAEQETTYWCGPGSMQMIAWGWKQRDLGQAHWASKLGTTRSGTAITSMVNVVNSSTGWDKPEYAGPYVALDISDMAYEEWLLLIMRHITDYRAPVVLHPVLRKEFYSYLDDDASGHFQVGRGYRRREGKPEKIGYFEPWNQQRFDPSEPFIDRVQWRGAYKSYRANLAHFQHNIGV